MQIVLLYCSTLVCRRMLIAMVFKKTLLTIYGIIRRLLINGGNSITVGFLEIFRNCQKSCTYYTGGIKSSKFENFLRGKGFCQMINKPTHESGSLLDHIYINDALDQIGCFTQSDVCYYSDHDIVSLFVSK